ncbi:hypothetical protein Q0P12_15145, partial [Staphylococcus aureus]|nr:hypothetical protein [Staphylococcus aureus]
AHNLACAGDPLKVVRDDNVIQFLQRLAVSSASEATLRRLRKRVAEDIPLTLRLGKRVLGNPFGLAGQIEGRLDAL